MSRTPSHTTTGTPSTTATHSPSHTHTPTPSRTPPPSPSPTHTRTPAPSQSTSPSPSPLPSLAVPIRAVDSVKDVSRFDGVLGPGTVSVWSHGRGYWAKDFITAVLEAALPGFEVVWTRKKGEVALAAMSLFVEDEDVPPPVGLPYLLWSGENWPIEQFKLPDWRNPFLGALLSTTPRSPDEFHVPYMVMTEHVTPNGREFDADDIASRRYALGYINSHCTPERELFFDMMRARLGAGNVIARGACSSKEEDRLAFGFGESWPREMSDCKAIIAMENSLVSGYATEKIVNAFKAGAVPVFWGDSDFVPRVFNPRAYFDLAQFQNFEVAADALALLLLDDTGLRRVRRQPVFQPGGYKFFDWKQDTSAFSDAVVHLREQLLPELPAEEEVVESEETEAAVEATAPEGAEEEESVASEEVTGAQDAEASSAEVADATAVEETDAMEAAADAAAEAAEMEDASAMEAAAEAAALEDAATLGETDGVLAAAVEAAAPEEAQEDESVAEEAGEAEASEALEADVSALEEASTMEAAAEAAALEDAATLEEADGVLVEEAEAAAPEEAQGEESDASKAEDAEASVAQEAGASALEAAGMSEELEGGPVASEALANVMETEEAAALDDTAFPTEAAATGNPQELEAEPSPNLEADSGWVRPGPEAGHGLLRLDGGLEEEAEKVSPLEVAGPTSLGGGLSPQDAAPWEQVEQDEPAPATDRS